MYQQLALVVAYVQSRLRADRGDSPIPTAIIWVGVAGISVALLAAAVTYIGSWTGIWPAPALP
jgi:hypothetical protein